MRKEMLLLLAAVLTVAGGLPGELPGSAHSRDLGLGLLSAYGAESSIIESLTVTFKTTYGEQEEIPEPEISVSGTGCTMGDYQYRTDYEDWKPGKKVRVEITVHADEGKYFPTTINRSKCKVSGAEYVSAKALDSTTMQVKVDYKPVTVLGDTTEAGWTSSKKRATWKAVDYAPGYTVTLYGDDKVVKRLNVETNSVNLTDYMKDVDKTYYYEVKAVPITSDQKKYLKEGNYVTSSDQEFDWEDIQTGSSGSGSSSGGGSATTSGGSSGGPGVGPGGTPSATPSGNGSGTSSVVTSASGGVGGSSGGGSANSGSGGTYSAPVAGGPRNIWRQTAGRWSYFDGAGNMVKGWLQYGGSGGPWYYLDQNGIMSTGWVQVNGSWFYLGEDGKMQTGWIQPVPNTWYYTDPNGYMQTGWIQVNGKTYYLDGSGAMAANRVVDGRQLGPDGAVME